VSRNGSGIYNLPAGNPVVTGTAISSTVQNNTMSDIATALTQSLSQDGQTPVTANLPMGGFKLTGLAAGSGAGDSVRYEQFASPPAIGSTTPTTGAFTQITSTVATGTAPLVVASTTLVTNLHAAVADSATTATSATSATSATTATTAGTVSTTVASGAVGTTQARLDNSTLIATTAYAMAVGIRAPFISYNATQTLAAADTGKAITLSATAGTIFYLPYASAVGSAATISLFCQNGGYAVISISGAPDTISSDGYISQTSIRLQVGDSITLASDGVSAWQQISVSRATKYTATVTTFPGAGTSITQSHTMGDTNFHAALQLICTTAEFGYSIGNTVTWQGKVSDGSIVSNIWQSATQVGALNQTGSSAWLIRNKTSGGDVIPTPASWSYRFCLTR